jgi:cbb3-type cytochrome oxidase maturation protein
MSVILILIIIGIVVAGGFLAGFIWAVKSGQYDDTQSPAVRMLFDDTLPEKKKIQRKTKMKKPLI